MNARFEKRTIYTRGSRFPFTDIYRLVAEDGSELRGWGTPKESLRRWAKENGHVIANDTKKRRAS